MLSYKATISLLTSFRVMIALSLSFLMDKIYNHIKQLIVMIILIRYKHKRVKRMIIKSYYSFTQIEDVYIPKHEKGLI